MRVEPRRLEVRRLPLEELAEQERLAAQLSARASVGNRFRSSSRNTDAQLGSRTTIGHAGVDLRTELIHHALQIRLRAVEHAEVVERAAAAEATRAER